MKSLLTSIVSLSISLPAAACGNDAKEYGDVPLKFSNVDSRFSDLGFRLMPDKKNGWKIVDSDGSVFYFRLGASGQAEPCLDLPGLGEGGGVGSYCGKAQIEALRQRVTKPGKDPARFFVADKNGKVGEIQFSYPPSTPAIYIKSVERTDRLIKISSDLRNLDNSNYAVGLNIEAQKGSEVVGQIGATRTMVREDGKFSAPASLVRCPTFQATNSHNPIEIQGNQSIAANAAGNISSVKLGKNGAQVVGYRSVDGLAPAATAISDSQ